jgi:hypothetical protein
MDEMEFRKAQATSSYAKIYLKPEGSISACQLWDFHYGGSITYNEWVEFYRSGTVAVDGDRFHAPAHEMYGAFTTTNGANVPWQTISRRGNDGFQFWLGNGVCPMDFYQASTSY